MSDDNFYNDEASEAEDRIDRIRKGKGQGQGSQSVDSGGVFDDYESDQVAQSRSRVERVRQVLGDSPDASSGKLRRSQRAGAQQSSGSGMSPAMLFVVGLLAIVALLIVILLVASASGGGFSLPSIFPPADTPTPTPTVTPSPTATAEPTATPTQQVPQNLGLPPLECLYTGPGCYDYCQDPANQTDCSGAREFLIRERVDPDTWFNCVASGPGANVGNPQECLAEAWRVANP
jgi:hypothetical protein